MKQFEGQLNFVNASFTMVQSGGTLRQRDGRFFFGGPERT